MTVKRWALLEVELNDGDVETAELVDGSIEGYINKEVDWLNESFDSVSILWIADSYEPDAQVEEE